MDAEQVVGGDVEQLCQFDDVLRRWDGDAHLPSVDGGTSDHQPFRQLRLRHVVLLP